jgi:hypothetical protein
MIEDGFFKGKPCYYNLEPIVKDIGISWITILAANITASTI